MGRDKDEIASRNRKLAEIQEPAVKQHLEDQYVEQQREIKRKNRIITQENEAKAKRDRTKDWDGKPYFNQQTGDKNNPEAIGKIEHSGNVLANKAVSGYQDWSAAMQELLSYALELHRAIYYTPLIEFLGFIPYVAEIDAGLSEVKNILWDKTIGWVGERIELKSLKPEDLPKLRFTAGVNEQGSLVTQVYKNNEPDGQINHYFKQGVDDWASVQGFSQVQQPDGKVVLQDENGTILTAEKFKELNADFETSLEKFISNRMGMKVDYSGPAEENTEENAPPGPRP